MSVDLSKNNAQIIGAWKEVVDSKSATDWALYGYEGQSNCLKLISKGDGGLVELADELNSGKIMYAFVSVQDPKTSLTKFLLINWQGEGAPTLRKGTCANHIRDIAKLLAGAHLTIAARTEDDVEMERIMEKLSAVGSAYSFKENRHRNDDVQTGPVGTNYARVIPSKEINSKDRDNFWKREEEEERHRIDLETKRREQELKKQEEERRQREELEHKRRLVEANNDANQTNGDKAYAPVIKSVPKPLNPPSPVRTNTSADEMRQQRNREAKELIGSRVDTAKAIFAQNSAASQLSNQKAAPIKPIRNSIAQRINTLNNQQQQHQQQSQQLHSYSSGSANIADTDAETIPAQPVENTVKLSESPSIVCDESETCAKINETVELAEPIIAPVIASAQALNIPDDDDADPYSTIKRSPYTKTGSTSQVTSPELEQTSVVTPEPSPVKNGNSSAMNATVGNNRNDDLQRDIVTAEDMIYQNIMSEDGLRARALYDYQADDESEITFDPGDIITHIDQIDEGWWQGLGPDGTYGLFPANYVELIK